MSLIDSLASATSALQANQVGLDIVGQNLANANTPGYARRTLDLTEIGPANAQSAGRGVRVSQIRAVRDMFVEARIRSEQQGAASDSAVLQRLNDVQSLIGLPGQGLDAQFTAFFDAFNSLADDVTSTPARDAVVRQGVQVTKAFNGLASSFVQARTDADLSISDKVGEVNQLARAIANLNGQITTGAVDSETLRDQQMVALGRLSELVGVQVQTRADGALDVTVGSGRALVVGATPYQIAKGIDGAGGVKLSIGAQDITAEVPSGEIGGLIHFRDVTVTGYQATIDQLAYDFGRKINQQHVSGYDLRGNAGTNFFDPQAGPAGAASTLSVSAAIQADNLLVVGSKTGAAGDNQVARAIAALRDGNVTGGGTTSPNEAWAQFTYRVGSDAAQLESSNATHDAILQQLNHLRASASGVSIDEEAAQLMKYQRAYEASARFFSTIVSTLDSLMAIVS